MFFLVKHLIKIKFKQINFIEGSNTKSNPNKYKVIYVMQTGDNPTMSGGKKYAMFIKWKIIGRKLIIIGQNPSRSYSNLSLDQTNQKIVSVLKKAGYAGYIMINTFPDINPSGRKITSININKKNINISKFILSFFHTKIVACSISNCIDLNFYREVLSKSKFRALDVDGKIITHFSPRANKYIGNIANIKRIKAVRVIMNCNGQHKQNNICRISVFKKN